MRDTDTWIRQTDPPTAVVPPPSRDPALRIGPYRLVREVGRGGMGVVYLAEREDFEKQVAIKVIRLGQEPNPDFVRRFKNERQILARLEHPSIARLLDGGTTEDQLPYLVMEHVHGRPIDEYCRIHDVPVDDLVEIIQKVCRGVHFAHQNLLVHRDLKPSNVLVDENGEPKLLDFGIAKILDPTLAIEPVVTIPQKGLMTTRYASPEQIRFEPISIASDIYSLGVMLFELLTGTSPYSDPAQSGDYNLPEAICHLDPLSPSKHLRALAAAGDDTLRARSSEQRVRRIQGDLDSIVLKALQKDPQDRYGSALDFEQDLQRFLDGLPVHAANASWLDRSVKFARRHTLAVTSGALVSAMILTFAAVSFQLMRRAENKAAEKQEVVELVQELFKQAGSRADDGSPMAASELLVKGRGLIDRHLDSEAQVELLSTLGQAFWDAGRTAEASLAFRGALRSARAAFDPDHPKVLAGLANLALLSYLSGDYRSCEIHSRTILETRKQSGVPEGPLHWDDLSGLASALLMQGKLEGVEAMFLEVLNKRSQWLDDPDHRILAASHKQLAGFYYTIAELDKARRHVEASLNIWQAKEETQRLGPTAATLDLAARIHLASGDLEQAEFYLSRALHLRQTHSLGPIPIARSRRHLAELRWLQGDSEEAETLLDQALDAFDAYNEQSWIRADAMSLKGELLLHDYPESAVETLEEAHATLDRIRGSDALVTRKALSRLLDAYRLTGNHQSPTPR